MGITWSRHRSNNISSSHQSSPTITATSLYDYSSEAFHNYNSNPNLPQHGLTVTHITAVQSVSIREGERASDIWIYQGHSNTLPIVVGQKVAICRPSADGNRPGLPPGVIVEGKISDVVRYNHTLAILQIQTTVVGAPQLLCLPVNIADLTPHKRKTNRFLSLRNIDRPALPPFPPALPNPAVKTRRTEPSSPDMEEAIEGNRRGDLDDDCNIIYAVADDSDELACVSK